MARARNIKPSFFTNDELAEIPPLGRLLFIALWTMADREGRLEDRPKRIKAEALPYDDADADALLNALQERGFILRYVMSGNRYIQVLNFCKHQNPHIKESASSIPAPDKHGASTVQGTTQTGTSPADSLLLIPDSSNTPLTPLPGGDGIDPEKPKRERKARIALKTFIEKCVEAGEKPISEYAPLQEYVTATGLPMEFVQLCWTCFKAEFMPPGVNAARLQADWRRHFLNYVQKGYYRLWYAKPDGSFELSTAGLQAKSFHKEAA